MKQKMTLGTMKSKGLINATKSDTYYLHYNDINVMDGLNIRQLDQDHAMKFARMYAKGEYVPPIVIFMGDEDNLPYVLEGHHRLLGKQIADTLEEKTEAYRPTLEVKEFKGTRKERLALMIRSTENKQLEPLERARAYARMRDDEGMSREEIADMLGRTVGDVNNHLMLLDMSPRLRIQLENKEISYATVLDIHRVVKGDKKASEAIAEKAAEIASEDGKEKITPKHVKAAKAAVTAAEAPERVKLKFNKSDAMAIVEILCANLPEGDEIMAGDITAGQILIGSQDDVDQLNTLLKRYIESGY